MEGGSEVGGAVVGGAVVVGAVVGGAVVCGAVVGGEVEGGAVVGGEVVGGAVVGGAVVAGVVVGVVKTMPSHEPLSSPMVAYTWLRSKRTLLLSLAAFPVAIFMYWTDVSELE